MQISEILAGFLSLCFGVVGGSLGYRVYISKIYDKIPPGMLATLRDFTELLQIQQKKLVELNAIIDQLYEEIETLEKRNREYKKRD